MIGIERTGKYGVLCRAHGDHDRMSGRHYLSHRRFEFELEAILFAKEIPPEFDPIVIKLTWIEEQK